MMKIYKSCDIEKFSHFFITGQRTAHSLSLVVDDFTIEVNSIILSWWSDEFDIRVSKENILFLDDFIGYNDVIIDCLSLLHGQEVDVNFRNIAVILKFAGKFKIQELMKAIMTWFRQNISMVTFIDVIDVLANLTAIDFDTGDLLAIIRDFVMEYHDGCLKIIEENPDLFDPTAIINILCYSGPFLYDCFKFFNSKVRPENEYEHLIMKLENMSAENNIIVIEDIEEILKVMDMVRKYVENTDLLKRWIKLVNSITLNDKPTTTNIVENSCFSDLQKINFQAWRRFNKTQIMEIKRGNNTEIGNYEFIMIYLDWIENNKPDEKDVIEIYQTIDHFLLAFWFITDVRNIICHQFSYNNIPEVQKSSDYLYKYEIEWWKISKSSIVNCIKNGHCLMRRGLCKIRGCMTQQKRNAVVKIKFVCTNGQISVQQEALELQSHTGDKSGPHAHGTDLYIHWYLFARDNNMVCSFYTKSETEIMEFLDKHNDLRLCCLTKPECRISQLRETKTQVSRKKRDRTHTTWAPNI